MKCAHCGKPQAGNGWSVQVCADGRKMRKRHLCDACDTELNLLMLMFFNDAQAEPKIRAYLAKNQDLS